MQPDIIVAKLSQASITKTTVPSVPFQMAKWEDSIPSSTIAQSYELDQSPSAVKRTGVPIGQPWTLHTFLGTVHFARKHVSTTRSDRPGVSERKEEREEILAQYRGPTWLINRAWQVQVIKSLTGWTFSPKTFNVVPHLSPVFFAAEHDIEALKALLSARRASPLDCDEYGLTVLHVSMQR